MTPESPPSALERTRSKLEELVNDPCGFEHEFRAQDICDGVRRRTNLCCAHGSLDIALPRMMDVLKQEGAMGDAVHADILAEWQSTQSALANADNTVFVELGSGRSTHIPSAQEEQVRLGDRRMDVVRRMIALIDDALPKLRPSSPEIKSVQCA